MTLRFPIHPRRCPVYSECRSAAHLYRMSQGSHKISRFRWSGRSNWSTSVKPAEAAVRARRSELLSRDLLRAWCPAQHPTRSAVNGRSLQGDRRSGVDPVHSDDRHWCRSTIRAVRSILHLQNGLAFERGAVVDAHATPRRLEHPGRDQDAKRSPQCARLIPAMRPSSCCVALMAPFGSARRRRTGAKCGPAGGASASASACVARTAFSAAR